MKSTSGEHYIALDHVRALAAFMVFTWHFTHALNGFPVPFSFVPEIFPFSILDEGHTGVALFMTLSGYLFAKLLNNKSIYYGSFLFNRALRLLPLLLVVVLIVGIQKYVAGLNIADYALAVGKGVVFPTLPNGGWSITCELHYYLILPVLLWMLRKSKFLPVAIIFLALALRSYLYQRNNGVQYLAYWTIVGRIDQFVLGMVLFQFRSYVARRHLLVLGTIVAFMAFYWNFDRLGGWYNYPYYPSPKPLWIFMPTIEGLCYAVGIAWYDSSFKPSTSLISRLIGRLGEYSYSIYLIHFFVVFRAARFIHERVMDISNFYLACLWSVGCFTLMIIPGYLSFRFIEAPFLKMRRKYVVPEDQSMSSVSAKETPVKKKLPTILSLSVVLVAVLLSYLNHFDNTFEFDDKHTITENPYIRDLKNIPKYFTDASTFSVLPPNQSYRPVVSTTLAIDYWLAGGLKPFYFHLSTFILFLAQLVLLFFLSQKLFSLADDSDARRNQILALVVTALFGLHPVNAETVNYIIQRADLQSTLAVIASMFLYVVVPKSRRFCLYLIPAIIGMFAKPPTVMIVPILFVYDLLFEQRWEPRSVFTKKSLDLVIKSALRCLPALIISASFYLLQGRLSPQYSTGSGETFRYLITQPFVALHYFKSFFLPTDLVIDADFTLLRNAFQTQAVVGFVFILLLIFAIFRSASDRTNYPVAFGLSWYLLALLPTSLIPLAEPVNDHRMFFPFVGLTIAIVWWGGRKVMALPQLRTGAALFCLCWFAVLGCWTWQRNEVWGSGEALWKEASEKSPNNGRAQMNYGLVLMSQGKHQEALALFNKASVLTPNYHSLEINLGVVLAALGRMEESEPHLKRAVSLRPELADPYIFYGRSLLRQQRTDEAQTLFEQAIKRNVRNLEIYRQILPIYLNRENFDGADKILKLANEMVPPDAEFKFYSQLASSRTKLAVPTGPSSNDAGGWIDLSLRLYQAGGFEQCIMAAKEVLNRQPDSATAYNNIAAAYNGLAKWDLAIPAAKRALQLKPDFVLAAGNLRFAETKLAEVNGG